MAATNTQLILLTVTTLVFFNSAIGFIEDDENKCPPQHGNAEKCNHQTASNVEERDSDLCGNDKMCEEYHNIANNLESHSYLEVRDVTKLSNKRPNKAIDYKENDKSYSEERKSIVDSMNHIGASDRANESSYSPWKYVINRDYNRIPRDILETKCLYKRCLHEDRTSLIDYKSIPLMVTRYFHMKDNCTTVFHADFSYGCVCEYYGPYGPSN